MTEDSHLGNEDLGSESQAGYEEALDFFEQNSYFADLIYFFRAWPSHVIDFDKKFFTPVDRVSIGEFQGNVIFNRAITPLGSIYLIERLAGVVADDFEVTKNLAGFKINLPADKKFLIERLRATQEKIDRTIAVLSDDSLEFEAAGIRPDVEGVDQ